MRLEKELTDDIVHDTFPLRNRVVASDGGAIAAANALGIRAGGFILTDRPQVRNYSTDRFDNTEPRLRHYKPPNRR
jgi:hypothetical protein